MAHVQINDRARRLLHDSAGRALGEEAGDVLMAHLPPVGWTDVATKQDVAHLQEVLTARFEAMLHHELAKQSRLYIFALVSTVLAVAGLQLGAPLIS